MTNQIIPCPHCGRELMIIPESVVIAVRSLDQRGRSSSTFWSSARGLWNSLGEASEPFDRALGSLLPARTPGDRRGYSFEQVAQSFFPGAVQGRESGDQELAPGERQISKSYRERSMSDIQVPLIANLVSSGIAAAITLSGSLLIRFSEVIREPLWLRSAQWWIGHRWYAIAPAAFLATMAGLWFSRQLPDLLDDDKLINVVQEHERRADPAPIEIKPPAVNLEFNERSATGAIERQVRAVLSAPASNHEGLWQYGAALADGRAFPSLEGGKGGPGAQAFGYTESEFGAWRNEAERAGLLEAPRQKNQPWTITERGRVAFARIGQQQRQEASYAI